MSAARRCDSCSHLRAFELADDVFACQVVNIRLHAETIASFGCTFHQRRKRVATDDEMATSTARVVRKRRALLTRLAQG